ncbi:MAG: porin [Formosimonas sp.]
MSNLKKHIIAVAVLASFASAAQAASSVTLYGRIDVGYEKSSGSFSTQSSAKRLTQSSAGELRLGFKGSEDLGNGLSATFQMEGRFDADTGVKSVNRTFFDRESTVGLKYATGAWSHQVRFGRSISALEQGISFADVGRRASAADTYASFARHSNGLFVNHTYGGFSFGGDITTQGGYNDGVGAIGKVNNQTLATENASGEKVAYGVFAKYKGNGLEVGAAYQADNANKLTNSSLKSDGQKVDREWGVSAAYTYKMLTAGAVYSAGKGDGSKVGLEYKTRIYGGFVSAKVTPNDKINLVYRQIKTQNDNIATGVTVDMNKSKRFGIGYIHDLSKRTSVYADFAHVKFNTLSSKTHKNTWDIALRHAF